MKKTHKKAIDLSFDKRKKEEKPKKKRGEIFASITNWVLVVLFAAVFGYAVINFGVQMVHVNGPSMEYTLYDGDVVLINKFEYIFGKINRYDIVAIKRAQGNDYYDIKRVVAFPGETIQIVGGNFVVDGKVLDGLPSNTQILNPGKLSSPVTLGSNEYFVLADNVNNCEDSRYSNYGNVYKSDIKGKVFYRLVPEDSKGYIK